jgi:hypothetical protein
MVGEPILSRPVWGGDTLWKETGSTCSRWMGGGHTGSGRWGEEHAGRIRPSDSKNWCTASSDQAENASSGTVGQNGSSAASCAINAAFLPSTITSKPRDGGW